VMQQCKWTAYLFESSLRHGEGQSIVGASVVLCERSRKTDVHMCLESC
jgi:hypothetical protein